ncbi:MAG: alpha/beta fold hydrolase [Acidimicrobiales bacterium]|jgi:pimeloyl-ACP methyl ester carboxylesterase
MALSTFARGRLWGARYGTAAPSVLALHGWGRDHHDFDPVLAGLDAVALDLPGHGVAPEPPAPWSSSEYAQWVAPALDDLGPGPVVLVGHSFGARVAVRLVGDAATYPGAGRIAALVLVGAPLAPPLGQAVRRPPLVYRAGRALHRAGLVPEDRMERLRQKYGSQDYRRASQVMRGVLVKAVAETAQGAYMPSVRSWAAAGRALELVWGEHDTVTSLAGCRAALEGLPATAPVHITVVPAAGHLMTPPVAAEVRAALLRHQPQPAP